MTLPRLVNYSHGMENRLDNSRFGQFADLRRLEEAAAVACGEVLKLKPSERVLIATNPDSDVSAISQALFDAAVTLGAEPVIIYQPVKTQLDFADPSVYAAVDTLPDVFISMSAEKLGKDERGIDKPYEYGGKEYTSLFHYHLYGTKALRSFWSPNITVDQFIKTVPVDYPRMRRECAAVARVLDAGISVRITSSAGTDLVIGIAGRESFVDDGDFSTPGRGGNLPAGEAFISPVVGTSEGMIVFDGSISLHNGVQVIEEPIRAKVEDGYVVSIEGGEEAKSLDHSLTEGENLARRFRREGRLNPDQGELYARNARNIGELGIGLNPAAEIVGSMLIDEKVYRTCHLAIGHNYDEDAPALIHLDGLVTEPTVTVTGPQGEVTTVLEKGELVL